MADKYDFSKMFVNAEIKPIPNLQAELLPCPFCGSMPLVWRTTHRTYVECEKFTKDSHRVMFSGKTDSEAFEAWNTRKERGGEK